ncbi:hypothetical protein [Saccharopolyspora sp. 6V]|uniref:hypothetical protein n=1 Tax=Saccharopolyspora sp. 6V TaxID=2877239 RepID=UPI001CD539E7|nr:hypothetical protein [Saccharopolyspora sp. 6V]MCA1194385.1 hypothetical protein [Saccharopolyspora sp. 6V]
MTTTAAPGAGARLGRFVLDVFPPKVYCTYAVLWVLALEGSLAVVAGDRWAPSAGTAVRICSVGLVLLYLRMVDEQKDLDYDREHNPGRPLVRGSITAVELRRWMLLFAALLVLANALVEAVSVAVLALDLGYALLLVVLERRSARLRDALFPNLAITYPVQVLLSVYVCVSATGGLDPAVIGLIGCFSCVFLHFEFARKTAWTAPADARMYSNVVGPVGGAVLVLAAPALAAASAAVLFRPWELDGAADLGRLLPYCALALPAVGARRFFGGSRAWPAGPAMTFVLGWYAALVCQAAVVSWA